MTPPPDPTICLPAGFARLPCRPTPTSGQPPGGPAIHPSTHPSSLRWDLGDGIATQAEALATPSRPEPADASLVGEGLSPRSETQPTQHEVCWNQIRQIRHERSTLGSAGATTDRRRAHDATTDSSRSAPIQPPGGGRVDRPTEPPPVAPDVVPKVRTRTHQRRGRCHSTSALLHATPADELPARSASRSPAKTCRHRSRRPCGARRPGVGWPKRPVTVVVGESPT